MKVDIVQDRRGRIAAVPGDRGNYLPDRDICTLAFSRLNSKHVNLRELVQ